MTLRKPRRTPRAEILSPLLTSAHALNQDVPPRPPLPWPRGPSMVEMGEIHHDSPARHTISASIGGENGRHAKMPPPEAPEMSTHSTAASGNVEKVWARSTPTSVMSYRFDGKSQASNVTKVSVANKT